MEAGKSIHASTLCLIACLACTGSADAAREEHFVTLGHSVVRFTNPAASGLARLDVDGDGLEEVIFVADASGDVLVVAGRDSDHTLKVKQTRLLSADERVKRTLVWGAHGTWTIVTVADSGWVRLHEVSSLAETRRFQVVQNAVAAVIGDVDANGQDELVVLTYSGFHTYSLDTGDLIRSFAVPSKSDLVLEQLDDDPALEIVLAGAGEGVVIDAVTHATEWSHPGGFGDLVAGGRFDKDSRRGWVGAARWYDFHVFSSTPWARTWGGSAALDIGAVATAELGNTGRDDILIGDRQWGSVNVYDSATQQRRFEIANPSYGVNAITSANLAGDAEREIVFAAQDSAPSNVVLTVADGRTGAAIDFLKVRNSPYITTAIGDVDGDGQLELVVAGGSGNGPNMAIYDFETGEEEWRAPTQGEAGDPLMLTPVRISLLPTAGGAMRIVFAGNGIGGGRITVIDGVTKSVELQIGSWPSGPLLARAILGMQLLDYNADGFLDFAVATSPTSSQAQGQQIRVFSGQNGQQLWSSISIDLSSAPINDILLLPSGDGGSQLVAVLTDSLVAFDVASGLVDWTLPVTTRGAAYVPLGVRGPEILVYAEDRTVRFYSLRDRSLRRMFSLPSTGAPKSAVIVGGSINAVLLELDGKLSVLDGEIGEIVATSEYVGTTPYAIPAAVHARNDGSWVVSFASYTATFKFRLEFTDRVFASSFEFGEVVQ